MPRFVRLALLAAILVGFALRVYLLGGQDLWGDEGFTTSVIALPWSRVLTPGTDTHPPLYYALLKLWSQLVTPPIGVGQSEFALRFLSVVASLPMIPLAYWAAVWLGGTTADRRPPTAAKRATGVVSGPPSAVCGIVAAWLMATAPVHVYYAQELRMYALASSLALASTVCLIAWLRSASRRWRLAYAMVTLLGLYTHYGVFFILPAHGLAVLVHDFDRKGRGERKGEENILSSVSFASSAVLQWLAVMVGLALVYLPWVMGQARYLLGHASQRAWTWRVEDLGRIGWRGLVSYTAGLTLPQGEWLAVGLAVLLGAIGVIALARRGPAWGATLLAAGVVSPLVVGWLANPIMPFFHERFVLMGAATLLVAVAVGLGALLPSPPVPLSRSGRGGGGLAALALILGLNLVALNGWYHDPQYIKSDYGQAVRAVYAQAQPDDLILLNNTEQMALFRFYAPGKGGPTAISLTNDDVFTSQSTERRLSSITPDHNRVWLINYGDANVYDPQHHVDQWLAAHGFRAYFRSHRGFEIAMYVLADALPQTPTVVAPVQFADGVRLTGLHLEPQPAQPGSALLVTLFWQASQTPTGRYTIFTHVINAQGQLVAQFDGEPVGGTAPTTGWQPGVTVIDRRAIELPPDLPPGAYTLRVGLYSWPSLTRLAILETARPVIDLAVEVAAVEIADR